MMNVSKCCKKVLEEFDKNQTNPIEDERDIATKIRTCIEEGNQIPEDIMAELYAFSLREGNSYGDESWGPTFGPKVAYYEDGSYSEEIPFSKITPQIIGYWEKRIAECTNPILLARYSGLVWELKIKVAGSKPSFKDVGLVYLNNLLRSAEEGRFSRPTLVFKKLSRGFALAISYNQKELRNDAIHRILGYEEKVGSMTKPGYWRYSYDLIIKSSNADLDNATEEKIISRLEQRLFDLSTKAKSDKVDISHVWEFATRLLEYYRSSLKYNEVKRILTDLSAVCDEMIKSQNAALATHMLEKLYEQYKRNGLNEEAEVILVRIQKLGVKLVEEMKASGFELKISNESIEKLVNHCLQGNLREILTNISVGLIPSKDIVSNILNEAGIFNAVTKTLYDKTGRPVSEVGPLREDTSGNSVYTMSHALTLYSIYLSAVLRSAIDRSILSVEEVMTVASDTALIHPERYGLVKRALESYFQNDLIPFMHIIVPQVEAMCLAVIQVNNGNVWRETKGGNYHFRVFDEVLRDDLFIKALGEHNSLYLRSIFTEQRGWNVRNIISHGLGSDGTFTTQKADRVFAAFLLMCTINPVLPAEGTLKS